MSDTTHPKFTGRTYGRPRICQASQIFDEVVSGETASVTVKECESFQSKGSSFSQCESYDIACAPKKGRIGLQNDPSSFGNDHRKAKSMNMQHKLQEQKFHTQKKEMVTVPSPSRCSLHSLVVAAPFCESGIKASPEKAACFSKARLAATNVNGEENDGRSLNLQAYTLKTDFKEVIVDEKPNSPLLKKYRCRRQQTARDRRLLTVCEPSLSGDYNTNSTNKLLTEKLNPLMHESKESVLPPNHVLASEKQDATVHVSKYTSRLVNGERLAKYFHRNSKYKVTLSETMSDASQEDSSETCSSNSVSSTVFITEKVSPRKGGQPQNAMFMEDNSSESMSTQEIVSTNGSNDSALSSTVITEGIPAEAGPQLQNVLFMGDNSSQRLSSPASNSSNPLSPTSSKCVTKSGNYSTCGVKPNFLLQASLSHDDNCLNTPQRPVREQYRIFKSRSAKIEDKLQSPTFRQKELDGLSPSSRKLVINASGDSQVATPVKAAQFSSPASFISTQESNSAEPTAKYKFKLNCQYGDFSSARESHAAQLHHIEQDRDSESVSVIGDVSEFSEPSSSQETPSNSQKSLRGGSQKSSSYAVTGWKFFKSRKSLSQSVDLQKSKSASSSQKVSAKTSYFIRSWHIDHGEDIEEKKSPITKKKKKKNDETDLVKLHKSEEGGILKREMHWPVGMHDKAYTTLTVSKSHKELYTVIQNVRQTHEVQELGETYDFIKEVDYLLESLKETNSTTIRCLSCLKLASKCISPAFRMHMRVHGTVTRIFNLLQDACSDPSLALSTSTIMFILSRDRLSMDLDQPGLSLMLKLNENDAGDVAALDDPSMQALEKTRLKVKELLGLLQKSYSSEVDLDFVSTSSLALESLLSLTLRRAGEWFKQELRSVGGLDHIVDSVTFCEENLPEDLSRNIQKSLPVLSKLNRYLKVLENISYMNPENYNYLFSYRNSVLLQSCSRTLRLCQSCLPAFKLPENLDSSKAVKDLPGFTILTCMLSVLMVMINITHGNRLAGLEVAALMETVVKCLTMTVYCIPAEQRFDLAVQCLVLLTNLVEHQEKNRQMFMDMRMQVRRAQKSLSRTRTVSAVSAIVELFVQREQAAREMEEEIESISDTSASPSPSPRGGLKKVGAGVEQATRKQKRAQNKQKTLACDKSAGKSVEQQQNQSILNGDETFTKALHKAGKHMENSIVAAYIAIFLGSVIADNKEYIFAVKKLLPNGDFGPMVTVLTKFRSFMVLVTSCDHADVRLIERVIEVLSSA